MAKPIPEGFGTVTPHVTMTDANGAIEFCKKAFNAEEITRMDGPGGKVMHAEIKIGDSMIMLNDEFPDMGVTGAATIGGTPVTISLYVEDCDAVFDQAVAAGATVIQPMTDQFWGDRYGQIADPFGNKWGIATHKEDLTPEEIGERAAKMFGGGE